MSNIHAYRWTNMLFVMRVLVWMISFSELSLSTLVCDITGPLAVTTGSHDGWVDVNLGVFMYVS